MPVRGTYNTEHSFVLGKNRLPEDYHQLPEFDTSDIFWLEALGKGGSGFVQKAYNKRECEFIAVKRFKENTQKEKKKIIEEDKMLQEIEKIRSIQKENEQP